MNLLYHSFEVFHNGERCEESQEIDVMDFIYQDFYKCITDKKCPLFSPYVVKLIAAQTPATPLLYNDLVPHLPAKLHRKGAPTTKAPRGYPLLRTFLRMM